MPTIKIDDLHPTGAELFSDSESYMNELGDGELELNYGGATPSIVISISARSAAKSSMRCLNVASRAVSNAAKKGYQKAKSTVYLYTPRIPRPLTFSQYCTGW